jgi:hypothetical protein
MIPHTAVACHLLASITNGITAETAVAQLSHGGNALTVLATLG